MGTSKLESDFKNLEISISNISNPNIALKKVVEKISQCQNVLNRFTETEDDIEKDFDAEISVLREDLSSSDKKLKSFSKKQVQSATEINDTIKQINDKLDSIKAASKESKRSPARHV